MTSFRDPIKIGEISLRNRLAVAPTMLMFADPEGYVTQKNLDYYEELARGGWGFITVEATYIRQEGQLFRHMQSMKTDRHMQGLKEIAYVIHLAGVKCSLQIMHSGRQSALTYRVHGLQSVAPSPVPFAGITPRELTTEECGEITDLFATCAAKAEEADKILLSHDPLSAMAGTNRDRLCALLGEVDTQSNAVAAMFTELAKDAARAEGLLDLDEADRPDIEFGECFQVVVECDDEHEQCDLYDRMIDEGYPCRLMTL